MPSLPTAAVLGIFLLSFAGLLAGAELLVRGAVRVAQVFGFSRTVVGMTVVAFGTSTPELMVTLLAAFRGKAPLAVGNIVGSNIANIGLILGFAALLRPLQVEEEVWRRDLPWMLGVSLLFWLLILDGHVSRFEGILLGILLLGAFLWSMTRSRQPQDLPPVPRAGALLFTVAGLALLLLSAHSLVASAVELARRWGVSEGVIGLSLLAVGTSLPEVATSAVASFRRETEISVGNIVGSNIFNLLTVLGLTAIVQPLPVPAGWAGREVPIMLAFSLALPLLAFRDQRVGRLRGALLLAAYFAFLFTIYRA